MVRNYLILTIEYYDCRIFYFLVTPMQIEKEKYKTAGMCSLNIMSDICKLHPIKREVTTLYSNNRHVITTIRPSGNVNHIVLDVTE